MRTHITLFAWLNIVLGGLTLLVGLCLSMLVGGLGSLFALGSREGAVAIPLLGTIGGIVFILMAVLALPTLACGMGLLKGAPWARTLGIIVAVCNLPAFPLGTALGLYGLWVLTEPEAVALLEGPPQTPRLTM